MANGISLGTLHKLMRDWVDSRVRIDRWTLEDPAVDPTPIGTVVYPPNVATAYPARGAVFTQNDFGLLCTADFNFSIRYRFHNLIRYDQLPITLCEDVLNNLYLRLTEYPGEVSQSIQRVLTPDPGTDVVVGRMTGEVNSDWLIEIQPQFRIEFKVGYADLDPIQPGESDKPFVFKKLDIKIYRAETENFDNNRLDSEIVIHNPT